MKTVRLLLAAFGFAGVFLVLPARGEDISCVAGSFYIGHAGKIRCEFNQDVNATKLNFNVAQYPSYSFHEAGNTVLACNWVDDNLTCTSGEGFVFNNVVTDSLELNIPAVSDSMAGAYVCDLVSDNSPTKPCNLTVEEAVPGSTSLPLTNTTVIPAPDPDPSNNQSDQADPAEGGINVGAVAVLVALLVLVLAAFTAGCLVIRCKYRLIKRTQEPEYASASEDDWNDIPCCRVLDWFSSKTRGLALNARSTQNYRVTNAEEAIPIRQGECEADPDKSRNHRTVLMHKSGEDKIEFAENQNRTTERASNGSPREEYQDGSQHLASSHASTDSEKDSEDHDDDADVICGSRKADGSKTSLDETDADVKTRSRHSPQTKLSTLRKVGDCCLLCQEPPTNPKVLPCGHTFCSDCVDDWLQKKVFVCPICKKSMYGNPQPKGGTLPHHKPQYGDQPRDGIMAMYYNDKQVLPGHLRTGSYIIKYAFPPGTQEESHPRPGTQYEAAQKTAYMPDTFEGRTVLMLLKTAFDRRLVFTMAQAPRTSISTETVIWNGIDHKTSMTGGKRRCGYPDPDYLKEVEAQLAAKLVTDEDLTDEQRNFIQNPRNVIRNTKEDFSGCFAISHSSK